jgi:hypothetical protein
MSNSENKIYNILPGLPCLLVAGSSETQVPLTLGVGDLVIGEDLEKQLNISKMRSEAKPGGERTD